MQILLATLCDSAADYQGKLSLLGAFDTVCARELPVVHPQCSLAIRICYEQGDAGRHQLRIRALDPAGQDCLPAFEPVIDVAFGAQFMPFVTRNIVLNLQRVKFEKTGLHRFLIEHDGRLAATIPLRVTLLDEGRHAAGPAG
jgi:hypothetical protein